MLVRHCDVIASLQVRCENERQQYIAYMCVCVCAILMISLCEKRKTEIVDISVQCIVGKRAAHSLRVLELE